MSGIKQPPPGGEAEDHPSLEIYGLPESEVHARLRQVRDEMAGFRARLGLLLNSAVQYELDRAAGADGIEVIAAVASIPSIDVWRLLSGGYPPTARSWRRIERILTVCQASRGVERVVAARDLFEQIVRVGGEQDLLAMRSVELDRRRRGIEQGIGSGPRSRAAEADTGPIAIKPPTADEADKASAGKTDVVEEDTRSEAPFTPPAIPDLRGHDQRPDPLRARTEPQFVALMRDYRAWAGKPSLREMERRCAKQISYSTFRNMLNSGAVPAKLCTVQTFVEVLGGTAEDLQRWATAWRRFAMEESDEVRAVAPSNPHHAATDDGMVLRLTSTSNG
jgi:hypothetical protein